MHRSRCHQTVRASVAGLLLLVSVGQGSSGAQEGAQASDAVLRAQPSGRARTTVVLQRQAGDRTPVSISIDYGQPHARGRTILGNIVPYEAIWRTGANQLTTLRTDVDLIIGGIALPKGSYSLCTLPSRNGWKLIINRSDQSGTFCPQEQDVARVDLRLRQLREPLDSFTMWLVPDVERDASGGLGRGLPRGTLRLAWGDVELSTDWSVR